MKLIQLNYWQGRLARSAIDFLKSESADIICLQEVTSSQLTEPGFLSTNNLEQLIAELSPADYYFSPRFSYQLMNAQAQYGNCILSRIPIKDKQTRFTTGTFIENIVLAEDNHSMSNVQMAILDIGGRDLRVFNHHGYHQSNPIGNQTTINSLQGVADWVSERSGPVILAGDLNVGPNSPAINSLNDVLRNLTVENNVETTLNQFAAVDNVACDYVMVSQGIGVKNFGVEQRPVSDHKALVLEFDLQT